MDLSIIIVNYNTFELTSACIQSILEKTSISSYEIILVDNASTEISPGEFLKIFPFVKLIENKINVGFAKGNNLGIAQAKGIFILLLNSDIILENDAISICLNLLKSDSRIGIVGAQLKFPDGRIQHNCQRFPAIGYKLFELLRLQKLLGQAIGGRILLGAFFNHQKKVFPDWIWGTFFMFKKEILQQLPGQKLADDFFMYGEDMLWCLSIKKLGLRIAFSPEAKVIHYMGGSKASKNELMIHNLNLFMLQNYSRFERGMISFLDRLLKF
jgi:GT2 family glycosyltransferase